MKKLPELLCRWNAAEQPIRDTLRAYEVGELSAEQALQVLNSLLAAATGRGGALRDNVDICIDDTVWLFFEGELNRRHPGDKRFRTSDPPENVNPALLAILEHRRPL